MTVSADDKKRVTLPTKPGAQFDVQAYGEDKFVLTRLMPVEERPAKVSIVRENGFKVGKSDRKINESALQEALNEFPRTICST